MESKPNEKKNNLKCAGIVHVKDDAQFCLICSKVSSVMCYNRLKLKLNKTWKL